MTLQRSSITRLLVIAARCLYLAARLFFGTWRRLLSSVTRLGETEEPSGYVIPSCLGVGERRSPTTPLEGEGGVVCALGVERCLERSGVLLNQHRSIWRRTVCQELQRFLQRKADMYAKSCYQKRRSIVRIIYLQYYIYWGNGYGWQQGWQQRGCDVGAHEL